MSKHHTSHTYSRATSDILRLTEEQLMELYGIEIYEDGSVYDPTEDMEFDTIQQWAVYIEDIDEDDNYGSMSKIAGRAHFDDEY